MEVVEQFLALRRAGKTAEAQDMILPNAAVGNPWSGMIFGNDVHTYLQDEPKFHVQSHLVLGELSKIDENTIQRKYQFDRLIAERGNMFKWLGNWSLPLWREVYYIKDGKIRGVTITREPKYRGIGRVLSSYF